MKIFLICYLGAGVAGWLVFLCWLVRRDWWKHPGAQEHLFMHLLLVETWIAMIIVPVIGFVLWPVCLPFFYQRVRKYEPPAEWPPPAEPIRSEVEDARRKDRALLLGQTGVAATDLKPGGVIVMDGTRHEAVSQAGFVAAGSAVMVSGADDLRLEVQPWAE